MADQVFFKDRLLGVESWEARFHPKGIDGPARPLTSSLGARISLVCPYGQEIINRFESKVFVLPCGCWKWRGASNGSADIGRFSINKRLQGANRVAHEIYLGPVADSDCVIRKIDCLTPGCCNPACLEIGTKAEALSRMGERGTHAGSKCHWFKKGVRSGPVIRGEDVKCSKLTEADVLSIRIERAEKGTTYRDLADRYGVDFSGLRRSAIGQSWRHLPTDVDKCKALLAARRQAD
jgi:hypothetical protein